MTRVGLGNATSDSPEAMAPMTWRSSARACSSPGNGDALAPSGAAQLPSIRGRRGPLDRKPKIVLAGIGTRGDLLPLLALGSTLVRRGHDCDLLSNEGYGELAGAHGIGFRPVTVPQTNNLVSGRENLEGHVFPSYAPTFEYFAEQRARGVELAVLNLDECSASNLMCELYGLPLFRVLLAPSKLNSVYRPAWPLNAKLEGPMAHTYRRYRLPQIYARMERAPFLLGRINPFRAQLGLPPVQRFSQLDAPVRRRLGFFPAWFGEPQPDWPADVALLGFPLPQSQARLPAALEAFLAGEVKPLVFTPGTGVVDVERFFADAQRCCERVSRPGVFLSPHHRPVAGGAMARIFHAPFVDLQLLANRSALLVHHGGIGTTARALEAGIPQIIRAEAYDQPDNGDRVARLGVGTFFAPGQYDFERMVADVERLVGSVSVRQELLRLSRSIAQTDAIAAGADEVENTLSRGWPACGADAGVAQAS